MLYMQQINLQLLHMSNNFLKLIKVCVKSISNVKTIEHKVLLLKTSPYLWIFDG